MSPSSYADTLAMLSLYMLLSLPLSPILLLVTRRVVQAYQQHEAGRVRALDFLVAAASTAQAFQRSGIA